MLALTEKGLVRHLYIIQLKILNMRFESIPSVVFEYTLCIQTDTHRHNENCQNGIRKTY